MRVSTVIPFAALLLVAAICVQPVPAIFGTPRTPKMLGGVNGGSKCAVCTLVSGLVSQVMELRNVTAEQAMDSMCEDLPDHPIKDGCKLLVSLAGGPLASLLNKGETADTACHALNYCTDQTAMCRLFPKRGGMGDAEHAENIRSLKLKFAPRAAMLHEALGGQEICKYLPEICQVADHLPAFDADNDTFSTTATLRGHYWRGKDCDDLDAVVFPGRESPDHIADANCNGIHGVDFSTGVSYEDQWCKGTGSMGVAALGDSATAHFHLPPTYFNASELNAANLAHVARLLEDEADWPMLSWSTGHLSASEFAPDIHGPQSSVYSLLREHNLCNHRDYANLGVNGAKSPNLLPFDKLLNRNRTRADAPVKPLLLIMSMIGNDVCNHRHDFSEMTTPEEYKRNVIAALDEAETFLPSGSHVVLIPLVDGRILFDSMHDRIHPIGWTNKDVTYTDLYDFLNCLDISPCWGWMNSNATVRNTTWRVASSLNAQLPIIAQESQGKYQNLKVHYFGNVFDEALNSFTGEKWRLIEPVDGFHPNQLANSILGDHLFSTVRNAGIFGAPNPHNDAIKAKFGDQGGY